MRPGGRSGSPEYVPSHVNRLVHGSKVAVTAADTCKRWFGGTSLDPLRSALNFGGAACVGEENDHNPAPATPPKPKRNIDRRLNV